MICRFLADATLVIHLLFIVFAVAGAFAALRWRLLVWAHLPCALWAVAIEWGGWICPLTPLEVFFRRCAGQAGYSGGFVQHYLLPVIYPHNLTREIMTTARRSRRPSTASTRGSWSSLRATCAEMIRWHS